MWLTFPLIIISIIIPFTCTSTPSISSTILDLGLRLDAHMSHRFPGKNTLFSPMGVSGLMAMFLPGAEGDTRNEIMNVLQIREPGSDSLDLGEYMDLYTDLEERKGNSTIFKIANRVYTRTGLRLTGDYTRAVFRDFGAEVRSIEFGGDPEGSRRSVNDWLANATGLTNVLPQSLPPDTFLLLVNAIFFRAEWKTPFNKDNTKIDKFFASSSLDLGQNTIMMQHENIILNVAKDPENKLTLVGIPYSDERTTMLIILPDVGNPLNDVMRSINSTSFQKLLGRRIPFNVHLTLPRFRLRLGFELSPVLKSMGIRRVFTPGQAELTPVFGSDGYFAQSIVHSVSLDIDETGSEASAAGLGGVIGLAKAPTLDVNVNRPFFFVLFDELSGTVLFMGRVLSPPVDNDELVLLGAIREAERESNVAVAHNQCVASLLLLAMLIRWL